MRALHAAGFAVRSFTPKHVFVAPAPPRAPAGDSRPASFSVRLVDLERIERRAWKRRALIADLATPGARRSERLRFLLAYARKERPTPAVKGLWRRVAAAAQAKRRRRAQSAGQGS